MISIVGQLRRQAIPDARLVVGRIGRRRGLHAADHAGGARDGDWIEIREDLSRTELNALMGRSRYGVHAMEGEHFGMATAEMIRAGCLVFPHRSGGSVEVVDDAPSCCGATKKRPWPASAPWPAIRCSATSCWRGSAGTRQRFSTERFVTEFRAIVDGWRPPQVS